MGRICTLWPVGEVDDVLCDLTNEHLRELGLPLGARLKQRAVAALSTGQAPVSSEITTPAPRTDAEREVTWLLAPLEADGNSVMISRVDGMRRGLQSSP